MKMDLASVEKAFPVLDEQEQRGVVGGGSYDVCTTDSAPINGEKLPFSWNGNGGESGFSEATIRDFNGYCYFNALDYLGNMYGCGKDMAYYIKQFGQTYGYGKVIDVQYPEIAQFTPNYFNVSDALHGSNIAQVMNQGGASILAAINVGVTSISGHAVVLTSYHSHTNTYSYWDPTFNRYGIVHATDVFYAFNVTGCKN